MDRVAGLQALFEHIAATRMRDIPICHPGLQVATVGFLRYQWSASVAVSDGRISVQTVPGALGVLITPWCINWVFLADDPTAHPPVGKERMHQWGAERYPFIGAHEPSFGAYEACSLMSPVLELEDQAAALALGTAVMAQWQETQDGLRTAQQQAEAEALAQAEKDKTIDVSRRSFLRGRVKV